MSRYISVTLSNLNTFVKNVHIYIQKCLPGIPNERIMMLCKMHSRLKKYRKMYLREHTRRET